MVGKCRIKTVTKIIVVIKSVTMILQGIKTVTTEIECVI